ncbi:hypothetical protein GALMADRAFT_1155249 [Galerina marginata CBS 339.88]|uniref:Uncharacterized protein n=1 Tax=Galerina marginata (strain CBS 339.88) TaxID=685588 RepID=A0A067SIB6_GALM3|nr:hypothetical protein GALMADRAFT_1155249 [Galerina marginata CBS 339.88]
MPPRTIGYGDVSCKAPWEIVHLDYSPTELAPKPSDEWTRFVCISDTRSRTFNVPDGDVLLHSRDLTNMGTVADFKKTMEWLYGLPHKIKINSDCRKYDGCSFTCSSPINQPDFLAWFRINWGWWIALSCSLPLP